ncbi:MAG: SLOG family protein [Bacillota bacterium]
MARGLCFTDVEMKEITCCFTGHRPQNLVFGFDEEHAACLRIKRELHTQVKKAVADGYRFFVSGMAMGVDLWAAEAVLSLRKQVPGVFLVCVLPCATQAARWSSGLRARHARILGACDDVITMQPVYTRACMFERNREMIERSNRVIAVYDGRRRGGTCFTVNLARREGLEVVVIDPAGAGEG